MLQSNNLSSVIITNLTNALYAAKDANLSARRDVAALRSILGEGANAASTRDLIHLASAAHDAVTQIAVLLGDGTNALVRVHGGLQAKAREMGAAVHDTPEDGPIGGGHVPIGPCGRDEAQFVAEIEARLVRAEASMNASLIANGSLSVALVQARVDAALPTAGTAILKRALEAQRVTIEAAATLAGVHSTLAEAGRVMGAVVHDCPPNEPMGFDGENEGTPASPTLTIMAA